MGKRWATFAARARRHLPFVFVFVFLGASLYLCRTRIFLELTEVDVVPSGAECQGGGGEGGAWATNGWIEIEGWLGGRDEMRDLGFGVAIGKGASPPTWVLRFLGKKVVLTWCGCRSARWERRCSEVGLATSRRMHVMMAFGNKAVRDGSQCCWDKGVGVSL